MVRSSRRRASAAEEGTAGPYPIDMGCLAAGVLVLGLCHLYRRPFPRRGGSRSGSGNGRIRGPVRRRDPPAPSGAAAQEIVLPGNLGLHRHPHLCPHQRISQAWYADIGAHVKQGAIIGHHQLSRSGSATAAGSCGSCHRADQSGLAKINAPRYQGLLAQNAVSKQDTDTFVSQAQATQFRGPGGPGQCPAPGGDAIV